MMCGNGGKHYMAYHTIRVEKTHVLYIYNEESMNIDDRSERVCDIAFFSSPSKFFLYV